MQKHPEITSRRIEQFILEFLEPRFGLRKLPLEIEMYQMGVEEYTYRTPAELAGALASGEAKMTPVKPGHAWGPIWTTAWFRLRGTVPAEWEGEPVVASINTGAESIVWGETAPSQGIDWAHREYLITQSAKAGETVDLWVEAYGGNPNVSVHGKPKDPAPKPFVVSETFLAVYERDLVGLYLDVKAAFELMKELPENEPRRGQLLWTLNEVVNLCNRDFPPIKTFTRIQQFDWLAADSTVNEEAPETPVEPLTPEQITKYRETIRAARAILAETFNKPASASAHELSCMGHAHIDSAWLWPVWVTQRKCAHTFSTATRFMEHFPHYKFVCSQAVQYDWIKNDHPELFQRIKDKVAEGRWEPTGSMWVEADCNLAGGESLVRQFLYGKRFFQQEFGVETKDMFLPDVFGYAASLPQILRKCRIDYFLTQKISWNQTNRFPHHTFLWQGIDGSQVLSHFPPADTYNGNMKPKEILYSVHNYKEHDRSERSLYLYGIGDGGGGPTVEMIENLARFDDIEGLPRMKSEFLRTFFKKLVGDYWDIDGQNELALDGEAPATNGEPLQPYYLGLPQKRTAPVWAGELYLELHRGTYTSQAKNKRHNRKAELALRDAEFLWCVCPGGLQDYPKEKLERAWKIVLLNQFHDIIPGSSIAEVYRDSEKTYAEAFEIIDELINEALHRIASAVDIEGVEQPTLVFNNVPPYLYYQEDEEGEVEFEKPAAYGYQVVDSALPDEFETAVEADERRLENGVLLVEFDQNGLIKRIVDKIAEREVMPPGARGNLLQLFDDRPLFWDAWDIDPFYAETGVDLTELESVEVLQNGPAKGVLRFTRSFGSSRIVQTVSLAADSALIQIDNEVDWHEEMKMLKVAFPVAINTPRATFEIQYGHVERSTHQNTSWDAARFEVCAHKWVDMSEGDYGVALLNDCKYGHDVLGNTLRLTLLRAPMAPDPDCDRGRHEFSFALLPHIGDFREGGVVEEAYALNVQERAYEITTANRKPSLPSRMSYFEVTKPGVVIEAVKRAEDEEAIIVRLYEAYNTRGFCTLTTALPVKQAYLCDMLEQNLQELPLDGRSLELFFNPFEIHTVKLVLG